MKNLSLLKKFSLITVIITVIMLLIGYFILNNQKNDLEEEVIQNTMIELQNNSESALESKLDVGISNAISIANDSMIKKSLKEENRDLGIEVLKNLSANMKESTPFNNIKVHIHTKDNQSFIRSWKDDKFGDDLSGFRASVVGVNASKKAINTFEVGKAGLSIRSVVPIFENGEHLGSLEFMQGINSVAKKFDKAGDGFILLMDSSLAVADTSKLNKVGNYIVSQKFLNKDFYEDSKKINFKELLKNGYFIDDKYFYTFTKIKDFNGKELGISLIGRNIHVVDKAIDHAAEIVVQALVLLFLSLITLMIASLINLSKTVINPINELKNSINEVKNTQSDEFIKIGIKSNDEIGDVVNSFNAYLQHLDESNKKDKMVIDETRSIIEKINAGLLNDRIKTKGSSKAVNSLVDEINSMISVLQKNMMTFSNVLVQLANTKYDYKMPNVELTGLLASLFSGIKVTQSTINEVMCLIENANDELSNSASELSVASKELSESSNRQAASLEETAAAIQEISSTIESSSENAAKMAKYAQNVSQSNEIGKKLANDTGAAMVELSNEVNSINEAISVIDKIAFQTNILSLNAAVEAATAGEAGKGFAVVAQEVRSLAARSAEAAKEIKELVGKATVKASVSKDISHEMLKGYDKLDENINITIKLISDVANASKEQEIAMNQINDTVNSLDKATQQNASLASSINQMSQFTSKLALQLQNAINRTSFDKSAKSRICDENLIFDANKLKSDHISFKNINFQESRSGHKFKVKTHHECNLGKWIDAHENEAIANTSGWSRLKDSHLKVHNLVQNVADLYACDAKNEEIFKATKEIEKNINIVFDELNNIREESCKNS